MPPEICRCGWSPLARCKFSFHAGGWFEACILCSGYFRSHYGNAGAGRTLAAGAQWHLGLSASCSPFLLIPF